MSRFVEKLNIQNYVNLTGNYVHYMYEMCGFAAKLNIQNCVNSTGNCVRYLYGMFGFAEKLNIQNFKNSAGNFVHYICTDCLALQRNLISSASQIQREIMFAIRTKYLDL